MQDSDKTTAVDSPPGNMRRVVWPALAILGLATISLVAVRIVGRDRLAQRPSYMQVVANDEEVWVFLHVDWLRKTNSILVEHPVSGVLEERFVFVGTGDGTWKVAAHCVQQPSKSVDWDFRVASIHRLNDTFVALQTKYSVDGPKGGQLLTFVWTGEEFVHTREAQWAAVAGEVRRDVNPLSQPSVTSWADTAMEKDGWKALHRTNYMFPVWDSPLHSDPKQTSHQFTWKGREFALVRELDPDGFATLFMVVDNTRTPIVRLDASWRNITQSDIDQMKRVGAKMR